MGKDVTAKEKAAIELADKCFDKGLNEQDTQMAIDYFIRKLSHKQISVEYGIEVQSSLNKKAKFKKILRV